MNSTLESNQKSAITIQLVELYQLIIPVVQNMYFNDNGSLVPKHDMPYACLDSLWEKHGNGEAPNITVYVNPNSNEAQIRSLIKTIIHNKCHDLHYEKHSSGALQRAQDGSYKQPRMVHSLEKPIGETTRLEDVLSCHDYTPEGTFTKQELISLSTFFTNLVENILLLNHNLIEHCSNIPSLSERNLIKFTLYTIGMNYAEYHQTNTQLEAILDLMWSKSTLPLEGLLVWKESLPTMKQQLCNATGNYPLIIKKHMLRALNPHSTDVELFTKITARESLRKSIGHSTAAINTLGLATWLHFGAKDDFNDEFKTCIETLLIDACKILPHARKDFSVSSIMDIINEHMENNSILRRQNLHQIFAPIVYDSPFRKLSARKQNQIRKMIRTAGIVSESLRPRLPNTMCFN